MKGNTKRAPRRNSRRTNEEQLYETTSESSATEDNLSVHDSSSEDSGQEYTKAQPRKGRRRAPRPSRLQGSPTTVRQRRSANVPPSRGKEIQKLEAKEPIVYEVAKDAWRLFTTFFKLLRVSYSVWKWVLLFYGLWLLLSYAIVSLYRVATNALAPICAIPILGAQFPLCSVSWEPTDRSINVSKITSPQNELAVVANNVGQGLDLAKAMVDHEYVIRDLRIRVTASDLSRKDELAKELDGLFRYTKQTAKDLSRFTAKVSKTIDTVATFDAFAVKNLEGISARQSNPPSLPWQALSALSPLAAFKSPSASLTEDEVKHLLITTTTQMSSKVNPLIEMSFRLGHGLDNIQETLDRIKELVVDELGDLPRKDVLREIWARLARPDDYEAHKSHEQLLTALTVFYESSSYVMKETSGALNRVEAELEEFRDDLATPGLILKEYPLEVSIALFRKAVQRLEGSKKGLGSEEGERPIAIGEA